MEVARSEQVTLAASQSGGFIFPGFLPAFDGAATLVNLLALLTATGPPAVRAGGRRCPPVHIAHQSVHTPWDQKGMVMRTLVERSQGRDLVLVDGVKVIEDDGWALVLPDPEEPLTHVWAEAAERRGRPRPGPRSTPSGSSSSCADPRRRPVRPPGAAVPAARAPPGGRVSSAPMNVPDDLRYSTDHEWARPDGDRVRVGITDYAQDALGRRGLRRPSERRAPRWRPGGLLGEVESTKSVSEIYAPVAGEVVAVNAALADAPETAERRPLRRGLDLRDRPRRPVGGGRAARRRTATGN